jgi:hypothetical protein
MGTKSLLPTAASFAGLVNVLYEKTNCHTKSGADLQSILKTRQLANPCSNLRTYNRFKSFKRLSLTKFCFTMYIQNTLR